MASWQTLEIRKPTQRSEEAIEVRTDHSGGGTEIGVLIDYQMHNQEITDDSIEAFERWLNQDLSRDSQIDFDKVIQTLKDNRGLVTYVSYH